MTSEYIIWANASKRAPAAAYAPGTAGSRPRSARGSAAPRWTAATSPCAPATPATTGSCAETPASSRGTSSYLSRASWRHAGARPTSSASSPAVGSRGHTRPVLSSHWFQPVEKTWYRLTSFESLCSYLVCSVVVYCTVSQDCFFRWYCGLLAACCMYGRETEIDKETIIQYRLKYYTRAWEPTTKGNSRPNLYPRVPFKRAVNIFYLSKLYVRYSLVRYSTVSL